MPASTSVTTTSASRRCPSAVSTPTTRPPSVRMRSTGVSRRTSTRSRSSRRASASGQHAQPAADVPDPERLLDVGDRRERRRGPARIRSGVGGIAVQDEAQPRVAHSRPPQSAQGPPGRHGRDVGRAAGQRRHRSPAVHGRTEDGSAAQPPHCAGARHEIAPILPGRLAERLAERRRRRAGARAGHLDAGAVGEGVAVARLDRPQVDLVLQRSARLEEQVAVHRREGEHARAGVEGESVVVQGVQLPAGAAARLQDRDAVAFGGQARGHRQSAGTGAHDDDSGHGSSVGRGKPGSARRCRGCHGAAMRSTSRPPAQCWPGPALTDLAA